MATAAPYPTQVQQATSNRLSRPLHRLGRSIRTYVLIEGLALGLGLACLWFWFVFLLDWGTFKALGVDYLREAPPALHITVRWILLGCLVVTVLLILIFKLVTRLITSFDDSALALVLERRFPGLLEDRLVTAVELSDQDAVREYGYSEEMVDSTRQSAAERVERLSLGQVFDWKRLGTIVGVSSALFLTVFSFALLSTDTAARFVERDVLLMTTYWPRSVLLELPTFADSSSKAVPHGGDLRVPIQVWKYVVADSSHPEGWRPLRWSDCLNSPNSAANDTAKPWELNGLPVSPELLAILPDSWTALTLDEVEAKVTQSSPTGIADEREPILAELGFAFIEQVRGAIRLAQKTGNTSVELELMSLLPDAWQGFSLDQLDDHLRASRVLNPTQLERIRSLLQGEVIVRSDGVQLLNSAIAPVTPPVLTTGLLQQAAVKLNPQTPPLLLTESDLELLPREWRSYSVPQLEAELADFAVRYAPEKFGNRVRTRLLTVFDELDERANLISIGRRSRFRKLTIPDEVTVEFEQLLTEEERGQLKPRLGKPRVRRQMGSNEFTYEFKKIDRALRFRVLAGATSTSWHQIDVRDLPLLRRLTRMQTEMGYLHGSNERVALGPFPVALEGEESQVEVPSGTRLQFDGTCQKKLRWVRLSLPDQRAHDLWAKTTAFGLGMPIFGTGGAASLTSSVALNHHLDSKNPFVKSLHHEAETQDFSFTLYELAGDDLKLEIEFEDLDGIVGRRRLGVRVVADREPDFKKAQPEIVRRRMITPLAVIPFSGHIHDDHGLLAANYEVTVEQLDRKVVRRHVFPMRHFRPLGLPDEAPDDLAFEKRDDVTLSRLLAGARGDHAWAAHALARLPLLGPLGWAQPPYLEPTRDYVFEFRTRPGSEPVLSPGDEFFDTLLLRESPNFAQPAESGAAPLALPYRITVRLAARDNRVQTGPNGKPQPHSQESRSPETFDFTVVSEEELLIESGKREEDLRDRCETIIANIQKGRMSILKRLREDFDGGFQAKEGNFDFRRASADAMDMHKLLLENQLALDNDVARSFREIYREFVLNRCKEQVLERIDKKICRPLEATLLPGQHFARAEDSVENLARRLEAERQATPRIAIEEAIERTDRLVQRLEEILGEMKKLIEFNQALKVLQEIIDKQREILEAVRKKEREERLKELNDR